jgi:hypothetical protein
MIQELYRKDIISMQKLEKNVLCVYMKSYLE